SGPAEGLSDFAVRTSAGAARRPRHLRRWPRETRRPDAHPHGRGCGQVAARGISGFGPPDLHRLQPQRRAAHRNRHRARHAFGRVMQETRLWDSAAGRTLAIRSKEEAHDYRYFPEPDLPPLVVDHARIAAVKQTMPELPEARRQRFVAAYGLPGYDAGVLTAS